MDIHNNDPFTEVNVLERLVHRNIVPRYLTNALRPVVRRSFTSEFGVVVSEAGQISQLDYSARGTPLEQNTLNGRKMNKIQIPRFGKGFTVNTEEKRDASNVALNGGLEAAQSLVDRHLEDVNSDMDAFEERQLTQAVQGLITGRSGNVICNLFEELGAQQQKVTIDLTDPRPWIRQIQKGFNYVDDGLTGDVATGGYLLVGGAGVGTWMEGDPTFLQSQTSDTAVRLSIEDTRGFRRVNQSLSFLPARKGYFAPTKAFLIPIIPGFWVKMLGPSDSEIYEGQVLDRYVTREALRHGHGWEYEVTEFLLQYPRKPAAVVEVEFEGLEEILASYED